MSDRVNVIAEARAVFDQYNKDAGRINGNEALAARLVAEFRQRLSAFPDALRLLNDETMPASSALPPDATRLRALAGWADGILRANPTDLNDLPRWARHIAGIPPSLARSALKEAGSDDLPSDEGRDRADKIFEAATALGIHLPERPTGQITRAKLWQNVDTLVLKVEERQEQAKAQAQDTKKGLLTNTWATIVEMTDHTVSGTIIAALILALIGYYILSRFGFSLSDFEFHSAARP